jgi:hypothetical protein
MTRPQLALLQLKTRRQRLPTRSRAAWPLKVLEYAYGGTVLNGIIRGVQGVQFILILCPYFLRGKSRIILYLDPLKQSLLDTVQDGVVLNDSQVFSFGLEHLAGILAGGHGADGHLLGLHLLGNLASG